MLNQLKKIEVNFNRNIEYVKSLMHFDTMVIGIAIDSLEALVDKLKNLHRIDNPNLTAEKTLNILTNIRDHDSLKSSYYTMYNQCIVLLVSYFSSTIEEIFKVSLNTLLKKKYEKMEEDDTKDNKSSKKTITLTLSEIIKNNYNLQEKFSELFLSKNNEISFQDMQSISKAFLQYLDINIDQDEDVNNIILGQQSRHIIVHSGCVIDDKLINSVQEAIPRRVKLEIKRKEIIQFIPEEIEIISISMEKYIKKLIEKINKKCEEN